jgi:CheY-like chemotaxis protein
MPSPIDDNEDSLLLLVEIFKHCRAEVIGARDTFEARDVLQRMWPDVIVTDINLPRETGLEFAEWVHAHNPERARVTPIIAVTATSPVIRITRPPVIDAVVHKPIVLEEVCSLVERSSGNGAAVTTEHPGTKFKMCCLPMSPPRSPTSPDCRDVGRPWTQSIIRSPA